MHDVDSLSKVDIDKLIEIDEVQWYENSLKSKILTFQIKYPKLKPSSVILKNNSKIK